VLPLQQSDIIKVRRAVNANVGQKVRVKANKGRHRFAIIDGVIQGSYPSVFTIRLNGDGKMADRLVSYSYTDVLTQDVQLVLCK
jgi:uncharacterized protein Veg